MHVRIVGKSHWDKDGFVGSPLWDGGGILSTSTTSFNQKRGNFSHGSRNSGQKTEIGETRAGESLGDDDRQGMR